MTPLDLEPSLAPDLGSESEGMSENRTNETIVPKSVFTPNEQSLGFLRSAPDTAADFDAKFGHGLAARYLSEPVVTNSEPEPVQIDTGHILRTMNGEPDVPGELLGQVDARNALSASKRDLAIIESLNRSKDRPIDWDIAPAIAAADANVATWQRWQASNQDPKLAEGYKQGLELARARRQTVLDAEARQPGWLPKQVKDAQAARDKADKKFSDELKSGILSNSTQAETLLAKERYLEVRRIEDDAKAGIERRMGPRDRIKAAETLAAANSAVVNAEDALEAAQADPNLAQTGRTVAFYEDQLKTAKTRQFEMQRFYEYGTQAKRPDEVGLKVEFMSSFSQSLTGTALGMVGKGFEHGADEFGIEGLRGVGEAAGYISKDLGRDIAPYEGAQFSDAFTSTFWTEPGAKRRAAHWMAYGLGQMAGTAGPIFAGYVGAGMIGAGSIGLTMGVGEAKNILEDALAEQGVAYDPAKHKHFVRAYGLAIGALDTAAAGFLIGKATGDIKQQAAKHVAKVYAKNIAKGLAAEGLTEGMQEALGMTLEWHAADKKIDPKEFAKRVVDAFGIGALGGGAVASAHIPTRLREEKDLGRVLEEMTPEERKTFSEGVSNDIVKELQEEAKAQAEKSGTGREAVEAEAVVPIPEAVKEPEPVKVDPGQDAISFIRERGGIRDDGGDLASMGAPKSIIRKDGMSADDMREALVEAGYLTEIGDYTGGEAQTTENDVFELVARSLSGEKVFVRGTDAAAELAAYDKNRSTLETEEATAIIRDLQREMEANEIPYNLTDAEEVRIVELVRDKMMDPFDAMEKLAVDRYNKGGLRSGGKGGASASSAPFPSVGPRGTTSSGTRTPLGDGTPRRVSGGSVRKLADYLREGGSLSSKAKSQIAERVGIAETDVPELLARAESEGVLKKDRRGRYRRGAAFEAYRGVDAADLNLQAAQTAAEKNAEATRKMQETLRQKKTFTVPDADVGAILEAVRPAMHMVPEGAHVAVVEAFQPIEEMVFNGKPDVAVAVHARQPDDSFITAYLPLSLVSRARVLFLPDGSLPNVSGHTVLFLSQSRLGEPDRLYSGGLHHELVHLYAREQLFKGGQYAALVGRAHELGILDMQLGTVLQVVGDPSAGFARAGATLRSEYTELYDGRPDIQDLLDQEAVAYLIELNHHGHWTPEDLAPVRDIIARFEAGAFAGRGISSGGGITFAIRAYHGSPHDFDKFDMSKIGAGSGGDEYGHGFYFSESERFAREFKDTLEDVTYGGKAFDMANPKHVAAQAIYDAGGDKARALAALDERLNGGLGADDRQVIERARKLAARSDTLRGLLDRLPQAEGGRLYQVQISARPDEFIDWAKLQKSQQAELRDPDEVARLRSSGVPGVRYQQPGLDGYNYVVFDETLIEIVAKDGKPVNADAKAGIMAALTGRSANLDMSEEARLERAQEQGFDTSKVWYHGTRASFDSFTASADGMLGPGVYMTPNIEHAQSFGGNIIPSYLRGRLASIADVPNDVVSRKDYDDAIGRDHIPALRSAEWARANGFAGLIVEWPGSNGSQVVIFDPRNIRSVNAAFDPAETTSPLLMAAISGRSANLDMSEEARLARAREQGFDTGRVLYHGTGAQFDAFDTSLSTEDAIFLADNERIAKDYTYRGGRRPAVLAVYARMTNPLVFDAKGENFAHAMLGHPYNEDGDILSSGPVREADFGELGSGYKRVVEATLVTTNGTKKSFLVGVQDGKSDRNARGEEIDTIDIFDTDGRRLYEDIRHTHYGEGWTFSDTVRVTGMTRLDRPNLLRQFFRDFVANAKRQGYDGIILKNGKDHGRPAHNQYVIFDPRNIRSVDAAFDPAETASPLLMAAISGRQMPGGQSRVPSPGLDAPAKSVSDLVKDLNKALGLTTRQGRLNPGLKAMAGKRGGKLQGQHNAATGVTRLALPEDIETLAHEGGHALEARFGPDLRSLMQQHALELEPLASPGSDALSEGFAEYFRRYVTNPSAAENVAPDFTNEFDEFLDRMEPGLRDALEGIQAGYQAWIDAPSGGAVAASVQSAKDPGLIKRFTEKYRTRGFRDAAKEDADKVYTGVFDELHPIKRAVDMLIGAAEKNLRVQLGRAQSIGVTAANDAYKLLRLARNAYQGGHMALMRGVRAYHGSAFSGPSYRDALGHAFGGFEAAHWSDANQKAFNAYLVSRRMVREWDRFKAGEITNPPDKLSRADHEQSLKDYEAAHPRFRKAAEMLSGYQKNLLTLAHDAGFLSDEAYQTYVSRSDYYVPLQRVMEDEAAPGKAFSDTNDRSPIKRFKGSTRDIVNPTESIAKFTYELHYMIARNDAIKALDVLARAVGPGGGAIAERIPATQMQGTNVDAIEVVRAAAAKQGLDELDVLPMIAAIEEALGEDTTGTVFRAGQINEKGEPIVYLWEGGKRVPIRLADGDFGIEMFQSITGLGKEWTGLFVNGLSVPTQALRAGITLDPAFIGANFLRDQLSAWILTEDFTPFVSGLKGAATAVRGMFGGATPDLDLANSAGIIMGGAGVAGIHESRVKRDVEKLRHKGIRIRDVQPFNRKFWELTGLTETGTRLAVFRNARLRALRDGLSEHEAIVEAAYTANDLIDFGRHGSKMLTARRLVTFLNASLQSLEKAYRVGTGKSNNPRVIRDIISPYIKSRTGQPLSILEQKQVPVSAKAYAKILSLGLIGFAMSLAHRDDEEYQEIPAYFRNTHWMIKATDGSWIRIPKPWELAAFSNIVERSFERAYHDDEKAMERLVSGLFELVTPPHTVPGVQVAYELWANKSTFSGMPIVPDRLQGLDPEMQFTEYTSEFSKKLAQWTGISAAKLDHAIMGLGGGLGRTGLALTDQAFNLTGYANRPEMRMEEAPFVRRFTTDPVRSSQSKQEFWKQMGQTDGELSRVATSYKELWDRGQYLEASNLLEKRSENQKVYALLEGHGRAHDKRMHPMNRAKDILSVTSGIRRELGSGELTKPDRTEYGPSDLRVITEMIEAIQMREARNAMIVTGQPGFKHMTILDVQPVMAELRAKAPDLADELEYRLADKKIQDFEDVRAGWPELKATVLAPGYAEDHPSRREAGRRSGYDTEMPAP